MWHYVNGEETVGPISGTAIATLIEERTLQPDTLVWREGLSDWQPAGNLDELRHGFSTKAVGLQLRTAPRNYVDDSLDATTEAITVESLRAPSKAMVLAENAEPESGLLGWMLFTSPFEFRFFLFTLVLAGIAMVGMKFYNPSLIVLPLLLQGFLSLGVGGLIFRIRTFQEGVGWGIAGLIIGISDLIFIFMHWTEAKPAVLLQLAGITVLGTVLFGGWMPAALEAMDTLR